MDILRHLSTRAAVAVALTAWLGVTGLGLRSLMAYAYTPGPAAVAPSSWPAERGSLPAGGASLLVMFVHPQCSCSRASISELARLMAKANGALKARVYVDLPAGMAAGWERTDLWRAADAIPGVEVVTDIEGRSARAFDAQVSGETQVYGPDGHLVFSGGITPARGHEGDSDGRRAILAHLSHAATDARHAPVFGCYLFGSAAATTESQQ